MRRHSSLPLVGGSDRGRPLDGSQGWRKRLEAGGWRPYLAMQLQLIYQFDAGSKYWRSANRQDQHFIRRYLGLTSIDEQVVS